MSRKPYAGPRLPSDLLSQVGVSARKSPNTARSRPARRTGLSGRKQEHKAQQSEKSSKTSPRRTPNTVSHLKIKSGPPANSLPAKPSLPQRHVKPEDESDVHFDDAESSDSSDSRLNGNVVLSGSTSVKRKREEGLLDGSAEPQHLKKSRKQIADDDEIAALEKKLGIKSKALPKSFGDDGLGDLLGGLDDDLNESDENDEGRKWLRKKRAIASAKKKPNDLVDGNSNPRDSEETESHETDLSPEPDSDDDSNTTILKVGRMTRENPYAPAPVPVAQQAQAKYVPPSLRQAPASDVELSARLKRQLQGQLNRLSESNLLSILSEIEKLFTSNPRGYVMSSLIDLLLERLSDPAVLNDSFVILHAGFIAAVYKVMGQDFGAQFVDRFVARFDQCYGEVAAVDAAEATSSKSTVNLCSSLAQLYNLQVVNSVIVFDYVRLFLSSVSETHTELLLRIVRSSGQQLRHDDPMSLKDIVLSLQRKIGGTDISDVSVRTKFMLETITALKDNKLKQNAANSAAASEHLVRIRKTLGSMSKRNLRASEPLSIGLKDIREADKRGKWWLVGASWKGRSEDGDVVDQASNNEAHDSADDSDEPEANMLALARANRMTTPLRQRIFVALLGASDHRDAHARLIKLRLTQKQSLEIPRVIIHCAAVEPASNPYWSVVARRLCAERRLAKAFLFGAWGLYRRMGASGPQEDESESEESVAEEGSVPTMRETLNLATLYADLLASRVLPISLLKHLDLPQLSAKSRARAFAEVLLVTTILRVIKQRNGKNVEKKARAHLDIQELEQVFNVASVDARLGLGLRWFLERVVANSDLAGKKRERRAVSKACSALCERLAGLRGVDVDDGFEDEEVDSS